jgi:hypothetical protein
MKSRACSEKLEEKGDERALAKIEASRRSSSSYSREADVRGTGSLTASSIGDVVSDAVGEVVLAGQRRRDRGAWRRGPWRRSTHGHGRAEADVVNIQRRGRAADVKVLKVMATERRRTRRRLAGEAWRRQDMLMRLRR